MQKLISFTFPRTDDVGMSDSYSSTRQQRKKSIPYKPLRQPVVAKYFSLADCTSATGATNTAFNSEKWRERQSLTGSPIHLMSDESSNDMRCRKKIHLRSLVAIHSWSQ